MKEILIWIVLGGAPFLALAKEDFEAPKYEVGQPFDEEVLIAGQHATISNEQSASGQQSIKADQGGRIEVSLHPELTDDVRFIDFYVLPTFGEDSKIQIGDANINFDVEAGHARLTVTDKNGPVDFSEEKISSLAIDEHGVSENWVRITLRMNGKEADIFLNGVPLIPGINLGVGVETVVVNAPQSGAIFFDNFDETTENPLFADRDRDGMPDVEEKVFGLNGYGNDRKGDLDGDGVSNVGEFFEGTSPKKYGVNGEGTELIYVDNVHGNDSNTGLFSYPGGGSKGPKKSIEAAIEAVNSGATLLVLPGTGTYEGSVSNPQKKRLIFKCIERTILRTKK